VAFLAINPTGRSLQKHGALANDLFTQAVTGAGIPLTNLAQQADYLALPR
jgi:hypothetical protein